MAKATNTEISLARLAGWMMLGHEPTMQELREELVAGGIDSPDRLWELVHTEHHDG